MSSQCNVPHEQAACWCLPTEFVRPRFFYGQRLGVVDFSDWLWYHAGKQRFHNLNSHGIGVLCGLRAEPYLRPGEERTTLLTITAGAAFDDCGREVIVPVDQCVDVAAWYLQNEDRLTEWVTLDDHCLCVGLRYRECPSDPGPAPRDPCGCDAGGCEYARVREGFELRLFTHEEMEALGPPSPACDAHRLLREALSGLDGSDVSCPDLGRLIHDLMPAACPPPGAGGWLWLACLGVDLVARGEGRFEVESIGEPDNAIPERLELLSTAALQQLLLGLAASAAAAGLVGEGPRFSGIDFVDGALVLGVELYTDPGVPAPTPLAAGTFEPGYVHLHRLGLPLVGTTVATPGLPRHFNDPSSPLVPNDTATPSDGVRPETAIMPAAATDAWHEVGLGDVEYVQEDRRIVIHPDGDLRPGAYRLTVTSPPEAPIVDIAMRPILPMTYARNFRLVQEGDGLVLAPTF